MSLHSNRHKNRNTFYDVVLALLLFLFVTFVVMSPTIGNSQYYGRFTNNSNVTESISKELKIKTDEIAEITGIEKQAFVSSVGEKAISSAKKDMVVAMFEGRSPDYKESVSIETRYREGIKEFYRANGIDDQLDEAALERAVELACDAFNDVMNIENNKEMNKLVQFMSKSSMIIAVAFLLLGAAVAFKIYTLNYGRTKVFSHYGSSAIAAGGALVLLCVANLVLNFSSRLYLTNNDAINIVLNSGARIYFLILALFGIAFVAAGISMMKYVYKHYTKKTAKQKQEIDINRSLLVSGVDGDKTIEELVNEQRERRNRNN